VHTRGGFIEDQNACPGHVPARQEDFLLISTAESFKRRSRSLAAYAKIGNARGGSARVHTQKTKACPLMFGGTHQVFRCAASDKKTGVQRVFRNIDQSVAHRAAGARKTQCFSGHIKITAVKTAQ